MGVESAFSRSGSVERQRRDAVRDCFEKMLFHRDAPSLRVLRKIYATRLRLASEQ